MAEADLVAPCNAWIDVPEPAHCDVFADLRAHPEIAKRVGYYMAAFANLELVLWHVYGFVLGTRGDPRPHAGIAAGRGCEFAKAQQEAPLTFNLPASI